MMKGFPLFLEKWGSGLIIRILLIHTLGSRADLFFSVLSLSLSLLYPIPRIYVDHSVGNINGLMVIAQDHGRLNLPPSVNSFLPQTKPRRVQTSQAA